MKKRHIHVLILLLGYTLGAYKGYLALWKDDLADPIRVFPRCIASLPPADRQALERGIEIPSRNDLLRLLEDYLS